MDKPKTNKVNIILKYVKIYTPQLLDNELIEDQVLLKKNLYQPLSVSNSITKNIHSNKNEVLFIEYQNDESSVSKWVVNTMFEEIYNMFGEENFEFFVEEYYGLNITDKGEFKQNWLFDEI